MGIPYGSIVIIIIFSKQQQIVNIIHFTTTQHCDLECLSSSLEHEIEGSRTHLELFACPPGSSHGFP